MVAPRTMPDAATLITLLFMSRSVSVALGGLGRQLLGHCFQFRQRCQELVERIADDLLGGPVTDRAGETKLEMPLRIEPQREGGLAFRAGRLAGPTRHGDDFGRRRRPG